MASQDVSKPRRHQRISLPKGLSAAWYGGGVQQVSPVKTLGAGGVFLAASIVRPVGTNLTMIFEVPGGIVKAEGIVRSIQPGEGMGVEFTDIKPEAQALLEQLLARLLR